MRTLLSILMVLFFAGPAWANNVKVQNIVLNGLLVSQANNTIPIKFDLSQDNAFGDLPDGYGGAGTFSDYIWIFVKYYVGETYDGNGYRHAKLQQSGSDAAFEVVGNGVGAFVKASNAKAGMTLVWNYGLNVDGSDNTAVVTDSSKVNIKIFAIEMVKVPQGNFYIGDGRTSDACGAFTAGIASTDAYQVTSENALTLGGADGNLGNNNNTGMGSYTDDFNNTTQQTLPAAFPKGYNSFYIMKYELTQGQYRDFVNTLSRSQQVVATGIAANATSVTNTYFMTGTSTLTERNGLRCPASPVANEYMIVYCDLNGNGTGNEADDGEQIACSNFTWQKQCAFADWAGLRPITELEYEKVSRGPLTAVAEERSWGSTTEDYFSDLANAGTKDEAIGPTRPNANVNSYSATPNGPVRVGMFAKGTSTRQVSGASYYGVMELTGNLVERAISVGQSAGRSFTGTAGDGALSSDGYATTADWPGYNAGKVTGTSGSGWSGGSYNTAYSTGTSNREFRNWSSINAYIDFGVRLGRSA